MIIGYIKGQELQLKNELIVADTIDYLTAKFIFKTADWQGLSKWAHFKKGSTVYDIQLTSDGIPKDKHLNLAEGEWEVYLHGNEFASGEVVERITTEIAKLTVKGTGLLNGEPFPEIPASEAEQIEAQLADHESRIEELEAGGGGGGGTSTIAWKPTVDSNGNISWQRTSSETVPAPQNIKGVKGDKGDRGEQGLQGERGLQGEKGDTGERGLQGIQGIQGEQGEKGDKGDTGETGQNGADGYTPVRGTDYWTAADIATIKGYVDDAILGGEW